MKWRANAVCVLAAMTVLICELGLTIPAESEHTHFWRQSDYSEFQRSTAKGVAIRSDGSLTPAPRFAPFADPNLAYLWALRLDSHGTLFAAGGSNAKVLRFDAKGAPTTVFESPARAAQSLCSDFSRWKNLQSNASRTEEHILRSKNQIHLGISNGFERHAVRRY